MRGLILFLSVVGFADATATASSDDPINQARSGTAKVIVGESVAAGGFLCIENNLVITCLHVVSGDGNIKVIFEGSERNASVYKVLRSADLALLKLDSPVDLIPLRLNTSTEDGDSLVALGYPLDSPTMRSIDCKLRNVGGKTLNELIGDRSIREELDALGYPSLSVPILDLQAPLVPGMSGCPLLNSKGEVVGIGEGGLERGFSELTWGINANQVESLKGSDDSIPQSGSSRRRSSNLFGAELRAASGAIVTVGSVKFSKFKTRRISELLEYTDDKLGLTQIEAQFAALDPGDWEFDAYRNLETGAMFFVPAGATLDSDDDDLVITSDDLNFRIRFQRTGNIRNSQLASQQFESDVGGPNLRLWVANQAWSNLTPVTYPNGLIVRRKSFVIPQQIFVPYGSIPPPPLKYLFETFAADGEYLLSVSITHDNYPRVFTDRDNGTSFGQMILATQLSTFVDTTAIRDD